MEVRRTCIVPGAEYEMSVSSVHQEAPKKRMAGSQLMRLPVAVAQMPGSLLLRSARARESGGGGDADNAYV